MLGRQAAIAAEVLYQLIRGNLTRVQTFPHLRREKIAKMKFAACETVSLHCECCMGSSS